MSHSTLEVTTTAPAPKAVPVRRVLLGSERTVGWPAEELIRGGRHAAVEVPAQRGR